MADFGKLWFEMGVRDNVTNGLNVALKAMKQYHGEIDKVNEAIERWATLGKDFSQKNLIGQDSIKNVLDFQKSIYEVRKEMSKLFELRRNTKTAGLDTKGVDDAIKALYTQYRRLQNLAVNGDTDISKGALQAFRQQLAMTLVQVRDFSKVQIAENKAAEDAVRKNIKANKELASTLDKLKSKQFEMSNVRSTLMNAMGSADPSVDLTQARNIMSRLWSKQMQVYRLMRNGQAIPDNFFGADYKELIRQAKEMSRVIGTETTNAHRAAEAAAKANADASRDLVSAYDQINQKGLGTSRILNQLGNQLMSIASLYGAERLLKSVIQVGGEFETQHIALKSILGDVQQANTMFEQMKQLAVFSPFNFRELVSYSKQIAAFGVPYEEMYDTTKRLADMSAGLGVDMSRLILAYGQVRSAAVLRGQELRQFTEAGIPMVQALADEFTKLNGRVVTTGEVFGLISKRAVPFEMVKKVLWDMTNEGGRFYDMQFILADTLAGKWSNLQDAWEIMLSEFAKGESVSGKVLKGMVQMLTVLIENLNKIGPMIAGLGFAYLTYDLSKALNNLGDRGLNMRIAQAQKLNALKIRERYIQGEINQLEYQSAIKRNSDISLWTQQLAMSGRLNALQLRSLDYSSMKNRRMLMELVTIGSIDKATAKAIMSGNLLSITWKSIGASIKTAIGPLGWILLAMDAIVSVGMTWMQKQEEIEERSKNFAENAAQRYNVLKNLRESINAQNVNSDSDYTNAIDQIKDQLKEYDASYASIMKEVDALDTLEEKYMALKVELSEVTRIYKVASENRASFEDADRKTDGWFDEGLEDNLEDWKNAANETNKALTGISEGGVKKLQEALAKLAQQGKIAKDAVFDELGKQKPLSQALGQLFGDNIEKENIVKNYEAVWRELDVRTQNSFNSYLQAVQKRRSILFDDLMPDLRIQAENAKKQLMLEFGLTEEDFKNPNEENRRKIENMYKLILQNYKNYGAEFQRTLDNTVIPLIFHFQPIVDMGGNGEKPLKGAAAKAWSLIGSDFVPKTDGLSKKQIQDAYGAEGNDLVGADKALSGYRDEAEKVKEKAKAAREQGVITKEELEKLNTENDAIINDVNKLIGKDKKKGSGGGSKKDSDLEVIKNRVDLYKKFYGELDNAIALYGNKGGLDFLRENGFSAVFGWKLDDVTDYGRSLRRLTVNLGNTTEARDKFLNGVDAEITSQKMKKLKEDTQSYVSELQRMMNVMSENYNTYKKWVDLTGDAGLAARVAGVAQNSSYSDYLRDLMQKELSKTNLALTPDDVFGLDKNGVKALGKDSVFSALWEEWQKNQLKIKKDQLDLYEDAIKNSKGYEEKIEDVNRKLREQIEAVEKLAQTDEERKRLTDNLTQNAADKVSELNWEKFKKESDWGRVFGDLDNMSLTTVKKMVSAMKDFQKNTRLSEKETRAWQKAMKDLTDKEITLDPINGITEGIKSYSEAVSKLKAAKEHQKVANMPGSIYDRDQAAKEVEDAENDVAESFNNLKKSAVALAGAFQKLGSSFSSLGSSIGGKTGDVLSGFGTMLSSLGNGIGAIKDIKVNEKGLVGVMGNVSAVMTAVTAMIDMNVALSNILPSTESIYQKHAEEQKRINQLRQAIDEYRVAVAKARAEENGWIGDDPLRELQNAYEIHGEIATEYYKKLYEAQEAYVDASAGIKKALVPIVAAITAVVAVIAGAFTFGTGAVGVAALGTAAIGAISATVAAGLSTVALAAIGTAIAAGVGYAVGQAVQAGIDSITYGNGQTDARSNMKVQTQHRTLFRGEKTQNLEEWTKENLGLDLFDKSGLIDLKVAQAVLDSGATLVGETKETLEKLMELREQYDEWEKSVKDYISNSFGKLADDMTNAVWDWLNGGKDALDSFRDYASDTFKQVAQDAVKTFIKTAVLDKFEQQLENLYKAYSMKTSDGKRVINETELMLGVASIAGDMAIAFEQILPVAQELGQTVARAFEYQGYDVIGGGDSGTSSSNGIKSITENTADLIASYINAIRGDTSVNRSMIAQYYPLFLSAMSQTNIIANAQLEQLRLIVTYTSRNAEYAEEIRDILNKNINGANQFRVK